MAKIILLPEDVKVIQLALAGLMEDLKESFSDPRIPWDHKARKEMKQILSAAESAATKIEKISGHAAELGEYTEGDEQKFFTKES